VLRRYLKYLRESYRRLGASSLLAILGVAIGAANIIALISVTDTARHQTLSMMADYGSNTIFVSPFFDTDDSMMMRANAFAFLPEDYTGRLRGMPELDAVAGVLMFPGHVGHGGARVFSTIEAPEPDYPPIRGHGVERGRYFTMADEEENARVCCLAYNMVEPLFGEDDPIGGEVVLKGNRFTVVGTMIEKGMIGLEDFDARVYIPLSTCQELYEIEGVHTIMARALTGLDIGEVRDTVDERLREAAGLGEDDNAEFSVTSVEDLTGILDESLGVFRVLMTGIASVALLVAGTGIMNVMLMQVMARTREIGIRRAVGARRRDIWWQFVFEAVGQTLIGAVLGCFLGILASWAFCLVVDWTLYLAFPTLLLGMGFSGAVGIIFGVYPAGIAARMKPIDCLRYE